MSSKNNVNKDFYTLAGRDRPNELHVEAPTKHLPDELPGRRGGVRRNFIPGAAALGERPAPTPPVDHRAEPPSEHEAQGSAGKTGMRSGSRKAERARRGGKPPAKARRKAGAFGETARKPSPTVRAKRGTTLAEATKRSRRRAA